MSLIGRESNIWAWPRVGLPRMIGQYMNFGSTHLLKTWFKILVNENDKTAILSSFDHNHNNTLFFYKNMNFWSKPLLKNIKWPKCSYHKYSKPFMFLILKTRKITTNQILFLSTLTLSKMH